MQFEIRLPTEIGKIIEHATGIRSAIDVIAQEDDVRPGRPGCGDILKHAVHQGTKEVAAAVNVADRPDECIGRRLRDPGLSGRLVRLATDAEHAPLIIAPHRIGKPRPQKTTQRRRLTLDVRKVGRSIMVTTWR